SAFAGRHALPAIWPVLDIDEIFIRISEKGRAKRALIVRSGSRGGKLSRLEQAWQSVEQSRPSGPPTRLGESETNGAHWASLAARISCMTDIPILSGSPCRSGKPSSA